MATGRPLLIDRAGPSGAPAAVLHPDDPLPKTWPVVSEWSYRGQRGAWLRRASFYRQPQDPDLCQVVYRTTAKHSPRVSTTGQGLSTAARALVCSQAWELRGSDTPYWFDAPKGTVAQATADEQARAAHLGLTLPEIRDRDMAAYRAFRTPIAPPPSPAAAQAAATRIVNALAAALKPRQPQPDLIDELDLPMRAYNSLKRNDVTRVHHLLGMSDSQLLRMRNMGVGTLRDIDAKLAAHGLKRAGYGVNRTPGDDATADIPVEPGLERAQWIGDRITAMTARESSTYQPHTRRRIAAHRALSIAAGYEAEDAENDGLTLPGGLLLHLEGLNAYAARAFAGQED
jgi:hypothetical protein